MSPIDILQKVRTETDSVLLFHSATGKDSIVLAHMCAEIFARVECVFMYVVPGLEYEERYIRFAEKKYPNIHFSRYPHFTLTRMIKTGFLGIKQTDITLETMSSINDQAREATGIRHTVIGFKKYDSLQRRLMLRTLPEYGVHSQTGKIYPLLDWNNKDCIAYIKKNKLPTPVSYCTDRSNGSEIDSPLYLDWLRRNSPADLQRVHQYFPMTKQILFEYDYKSERNHNS